MKNKFAIPFLTTILIGLASTTYAQNWVIGAGFSDFSEDRAEDTVTLSVEYHHTPFRDGNRFDLGWGGALVVDDIGNVFAGVGLVGTYTIDQHWFIEGSVMPGAYFEADELNDLGSDFEIRSLIGVGYNFTQGGALSLALTHKSNASTADENPGVNTLLLRWHTSF